MAGTIEVLVPGGEANPGPPLGPEPDRRPSTSRRSSRRSTIRPKHSTAPKCPSPSTTTTTARSASKSASRRRRRIKDEAGFDTGSGEPQEDFVADLSVEQVKQIAEQKKPDLLAYDTKNAAKEVVGTCVTLGVTIGGVDAREFKQKVDAGEYDDVLADEAAA